MPLTEKQISDTLYHRNSIVVDGRRCRVLFLLPEELWRPLRASWWRGKDASIIGGDENGNYFLRHSDGGVRFWDHSRGMDQKIAPSVAEFLRLLEPGSIPDPAA